MTADEGWPSELYTIGQVVERLSSEYPDVTHSSLRFLEREGLIAPERTSGGHRLFPTAQIDRIRRIKAWQLRRLSLEEIRSRLAAADQLPALSALADEVLELLIAGRRRAANRIILETDDAGVELAVMFDGIIRPVLEETGDRWASGAISVGQEKEISSFFRDIIAHLSSRHRQIGQPAGPVVVAACVEGENHELGLAMITALLRQHGCVIYYLGPSVAPEFLIERIQVREPTAVLLCVVQRVLLANLERTIAALRATSSIARQPRIIVGGDGIPDDWTVEDENLLRVVSLPRIADVVAELDQLIGAGNRQGSSRP